MTYVRRQMTAYGPAMVSGPNAYPQPDDTYKGAKQHVRDVLDGVRLSQERCAAYKKSRSQVADLPDKDLTYVKFLKTAYQAHMLGSGVGRPETETPKTNETLRQLRTGETLAEYLDEEFPKAYKHYFDSELDEAIRGSETGAPKGILSAMTDDSIAWSDVVAFFTRKKRRTECLI